MAEMSFEELNPIFNYFYYLGLSPRIGPPNRNSILPTLIFLTIYTVFGFISLYLGPTFGNPVEYLMGYVFIAADTIKVYCIFGQRLVYNRSMSVVLRRLQCVDDLFMTFGQCPINYQPIARNFSRKLKILAVLFILHFSLYVSFNAALTEFFCFMVIGKAWQLLSIVSIMHITFLVDLQRSFLRQLCVCIDNTANNNANRSIMKTLKLSKIVYLELWETTRGINQSFGWGITTMILELFTDATFCSYWVYKAIRTHRSFKHSIRMSSFFFSKKFV